MEVCNFPAGDSSELQTLLDQMGAEDVRIGVTGRHEMTDEQYKSMEDVVKGFPNILSAHHGDCVGTDTTFHNINLELGVPIHIHPPSNARFRSFCEGALVVEKEKAYLKRNQDIVNAVDLLIAVPPTDHEIQRSGTWATIRYARKIGRCTFIIQQDGSITVENTALT